MVILMAKEEKGFEAKIKAMTAGGCACMTGILEKKASTLKKVVCKGCGKVFRTNRDTEYCYDCQKKLSR
ncbi:MAG: hypothetical protein XD44_1058 [Methanobacteriaceae archaeon 41_258]|nr:MAG: hypothetical protein XD44_1058 [Methanobacteriaceae archaeon 41_258]